MTAGMWRQGRKVGRTVYRQVKGDPSDDDVLIGMMDTAERARQACEGYNRLHFVDQDTAHRSLDLSSRISTRLGEKCHANSGPLGCPDDDGGARHTRDAHTAAEVVLREGWKP